MSLTKLSIHHQLKLASLKQKFSSSPYYTSLPLFRSFLYGLFFHIFKSLSFFTDPAASHYFLREHSRTTAAWGIGGCKAESNSLIWNDVDWKIGIYFVVIKGPFSAASVDIDVYIFQMQRADTPVLRRLHPSSSRTILTSPLYPLYSTLFIHLREVFFPHFLVFLQDLPYLFLYFE